MTTDSIEARVARGAAWLDHVRPGWRDSVVLASLDMSEGCRCVLGQVFDEEADGKNIGYFDGYNYATSQIAHDAYGLWASTRGFDATEYGPQDESEQLQAEWLRVIHQTRERAPQPAEQREAHHVR